MKKLEPLFLQVEHFSEALADEPSLSQPGEPSAQAGSRDEYSPTLEPLHPMARIVKRVLDRMSRPIH
ncbi:MAG TPA: hypothetical protein VF386_12220 [Usitatibacter sp.]